MALVTIKIEGLQDALSDVSEEAQAFLVEADRRIKIAGVRMEAYAKELSPVDTGWLRRNIRHDQAAPFLEAGVTASTADQPDDDYASYQEYGTSRMQARPYMRPAMERALKQLTEEIAKL